MVRRRSLTMVAAVVAAALGGCESATNVAVDAHGVSQAALAVGWSTVLPIEAAGAYALAAVPDGFIVVGRAQEEGRTGGLPTRGDRLFVAKLSRAGALIWTREVATATTGGLTANPGLAWPTAFAVERSGRLWIAGQTSSSLDVGTRRPLPRSMFLLALDASGALEFVVPLDCNGAIHAMAAAPEGGVVFTASIAGTCDFGLGRTPRSLEMNYQEVVVKLSARGVARWGRSPGSFLALAGVDAQGRTVVAGTSSTVSDAFGLRWLDPDGNEVRTVDLPGRPLFPVLEETGGVICLGRCYQTGFDFAGTNIRPGTSFIAAFDSDGMPRFAKEGPGHFSEVYRRVAKGPGTLLLAGSERSPATGPGLRSFVRAFSDHDGSVLWTRDLELPLTQVLNDGPADLIADGDGAVVAGFVVARLAEAGSGFPREVLRPFVARVGPPAGN